ncbi:unnamed protein product [Polarella glacialis]|uniref:Uncharacterized protein n=1 Tax=Polarella glacialis TaxID=89957 RepID=A0A813EA60_POLGL|nr:unnamed protein product [Polarella glacialis]
MPGHCAGKSGKPAPPGRKLAKQADLLVYNVRKTWCWTQNQQYCHARPLCWKIWQTSSSRKEASQASRLTYVQCQKELALDAKPAVLSCQATVLENLANQLLQEGS